jgi:hypothetical protein
MKKIIVLTAVFALVFTGAAIAADWNFYGSSRMALFSNTWSKEMSPVAGQDFTSTTFGQQSNSRIGANVAAGDVAGRFEYGTGVNVRLLYGTWNFGSGKMLVGQTYNPTYYGLSNQVSDGDNGLAGFGAPFSRRPAIEFHFGGFKLAAVEPATVAAAGTTSKVTLPKLEAAYNGAMGPVNLHVSAGWLGLENVNTTTNASKSASAMLGQVMAKYNAGPFMVGGSFLYGINLGNYGWNVGPVGDSGLQVNAAGDIKDTTTMGFTLVAGFTISDMLGVEAGYGYTVNSYDSTISSKDDPAMAYYIQMPITLADGVFIVPEVAKYDFDKDNAEVKEGNRLYLGAKFQINF